MVEERMKIARVLMASLAAALLAGFAGSSIPSDAQVPPNEFAVVIPAAALDFPISLGTARPEVQTLAEALRTLTVRVGGQSCLTVDLANRSLRNAAGELVIRVGAPGQPAGCNAEGARVTFIDGNGLELFEEFVFRGGTSVVLSQLGPKPPHSLAPVATPTVTTRPPGVGDAGLADRPHSGSNRTYIAGGLALLLAGGGLWTWRLLTGRDESRP